MIAFIESKSKLYVHRILGKLVLVMSAAPRQNLATIAGLVVILFSKHLPEKSEVRRINTLLLIEETLRKMAPLTVRNHIDARRDDGELHSLFDRVLPLPWGAGAWAAVKARPAHRRRRRRRHYPHCHDAHH